MHLENEEYDLLKRPICSDLDLDEYSVKATRTLYIGNLPPEISYQELREIYSAYGEIIVRIIQIQFKVHKYMF
jgi:RNA recognition motif-containing protein